MIRPAMSSARWWMRKGPADQHAPDPGLKDRYATPQESVDRPDLTLDKVQTPPGDASGRPAGQNSPSAHATDEHGGAEKTVLKYRSQRAAEEQARKIKGGPGRQIISVLDSVDQPVQTKFCAIGKLGPDLRRDRLLVADLKAWQRSWGLSNGSVVAILQIDGVLGLKLLAAVPSKRLPPVVSSRLRRYREKSKKFILRKLKIDPVALQALDSAWTMQHDGRLIDIDVRRIRGPRYAAEACCCGLWPGDLVYYRFSAGPSIARRKGCMIVHLASHVAATEDAYLSFAENRLRAEALLALKVGQHYATLAAEEPKTCRKRRKKQRPKLNPR